MVIHINYLLILLSRILNLLFVSVIARKTRYSQRGLGMIEILVTLVILSIGLLGVATLQLVASFNNADVLSRSQAVLVAEQVSERMRVSAFSASDADGKIIDDGYVNSNFYNFANLSCASIQHNPNMRVSVTCADSNTTDSTACSAGSRHTIMLS